VVAWPHAQGDRSRGCRDDHARLEAIVADRNGRQKHVERARIVLLSADGVGTLSIMGQVGCAQGDGVAGGRSLRGRVRRRAPAGQEPAAGQGAASSSTTTPPTSTPRCCAG
jgi:hypothetical protein